MTHETDTVELYQLGKNYLSKIEKLSAEVLRLRAENASLRGQIEQIEQSGGVKPTPALAEEIATALKAQPLWAKISLGKGGQQNWSIAGAYARGGGLLGLRDDLLATPSDDVIQGVSWDAAERRRSQKTGKAPRPKPARFYNHNSVSWELRCKRGQGPAADTLEGLTKGMRSRTLKAFLEVSFLLWGDQAMRCLREDPEMAVATVVSECERAYAKAQAEKDRYVAELFQELFGNKSQAAARRDACEMLGVGPDASPAEIRQAYRTKAFETHPDHGGTDGAFAAVSSAYELLTK